MICEMCGKDVGRTKPVLIEGTSLNVCQDCSRFGKEGVVRSSSGHLTSEVVVDRLAQRQKRYRSKDVYESEKPELLMDYADRIRKARQRMNMSHEDLGRKINEKKSLVTKIESGDMFPNDEITKKLERALEIKLTGKPQEAFMPSDRKNGSGGMTLADFIKKE